VRGRRRAGVRAVRRIGYNMITHISTVAVYVDDQEKSLEFWTERVGFKVRQSEPMSPTADWIEVGPENAQTSLVIYPKSMMENWEEQKASIVFNCADVDEMVSKLKDNGVEISGEPKKTKWGTYAVFKDIDGNEFILKSDESL
jgi:lactoylglutathione lyase